MKYKCNFHDLNGEGIKVAIIDSGIDRSHKMLQRVTAGICFELSSGNVLTSEDYRDTSGHGTAVASIIKKKAPDTELYIIKIFDQSLIVEQKILLESIRWAIDQNVDIINLSLGTTDAQVKQALLDICQVATKKGYRNRRCRTQFRAGELSRLFLQCDRCEGGGDKRAL